MPVCFVCRASVRAATTKAFAPVGRKDAGVKSISCAPTNCIPGCHLHRQAMYCTGLAGADIFDRFAKLESGEGAEEDGGSKRKAGGGAGAREEGRKEQGAEGPEDEELLEEEEDADFQDDDDYLIVSTVTWSYIPSVRMRYASNTIYWHVRAAQVCCIFRHQTCFAVHISEGGFHACRGKPLMTTKAMMTHTMTGTMKDQHIDVP